MSNEYHCPQCGAKIGFGEAICPSCNADVTSVWDQASSPKKDKPKIAPGTGGMNGGSPFPPASDSAASPFPPSGDENAASPFPPSGGSPFPPSSDGQASDAPIPGTGNATSPAASPFPSPSGASDVSKPFPPVSDNSSGSVQVDQTGPFFEIPKIGAKLFVPQGEKAFGRREIQGIATIALPDMNAYNNISRQHFYLKNESGKVTIEDKGSTNGTYLGTKKITGQGPQPLKDGDKVILPIEENGQMVQMEMTYKEQ